MKRIISVFLVIFLLVTCLPVMSVGASSEQANKTVTVIDEDFSSSDYVLEQTYSANELTVINGALTGDVEDFTDEDLTNQIFTVKETTDGTKYLAVGDAVKGRAMLATKFDAVTKGTIVTEMKIRIGRAANAFVFDNALYGARAGSNLILGAAVNDSAGYWSGIFQSRDNFETFGATKDANGFYDLKVVWSRQRVTDNWKVEMTDVATGAVVSSRTDVDASLSPSEFWFATAYKSGSAATIDIAKVKVTVPYVKTEEVIIDEDFSSSDYVLDQAYSANELSAINSALTGDIEVFSDEDLTNQIFAVKETEDKTRYLSVGDAVKGRALLATKFNAVKKGTIVTEIKIRFNRAGYTFAFGDQYNAARGSNSGLIGAGVNVNSDDKYWSGIFEKRANFEDNGATKDSNGFYDLKVVWSRASEADNWKVEMTDVATDVVVSSRTDVDASLTPSELWFAESYKSGKTETIDIAKVKVTVPYVEPLPRGDISIIDEDFSSSNYVLNQAYSATELSAINTALTGDIEGFTDEDLTNQIFTVKETEDKTRYLAMGDAIKGRALLATKFNPIAKGTIVTEMKIRIGRAANAFVFDNALYGARAGNNLILGAAVNDSAGYWSGIFQSRDNFETFGATKDTNGFYDLKVTWSRQSETDNWKVEMVDVATDAVVSSRTDVDASLTPSEFWFAQSYKSGSAATIDIAKVKVTVSENPIVITNGVFKADDVETLTLPADATNLSFTANLTNPNKAERAITIIMAVYNGDRLAGVNIIKDYIILADTVNESVTISLDGLELTEGANAKVFFLTGTDTLAPITTCAELDAGEASSSATF